MSPGLPTVSLRLADLLADPYLFAVPAYQRGYAWTEKEAGQLLEDVVTASGVEGPEAAEPDYFLGSILLLGPQSADPAAPRVMEIVDGQQRLVTLAILAAAVRDIDESQEMLREVSPLLTTSLVLPVTRASSYRIELRGPSQSFLEACVLGVGSCGEMPDRATLGEAERRMLDVREHFISELGSLEPAQRLALIRYFRHSCYFVVMTTADIDRAHRMFLVLNARGKALTRHEILKAEVLNKVPADAAARALDVWDGTARQLDDDQFEAFFSHLRTIHGQSRPQVIGGVRAIIQEVGGAEAFIDTVFAPMARAYQDICTPAAIRPTGPEADRVRRALRYLHRLNGAEWIPAAMVVLCRRSHDPAAVASELEAIERWAHVLRLLCLGGPKRVRRFADVVTALMSGRSLWEPGSPCQLTRDERKVIAYNLRDLHGRNPQLCKLALLRINDELAGGFTDARPPDCSVEHILPQRIGSSSPWRTLFPDGQEREEAVQSLGNLLLVSPRQNDRARNQEFARKREIFAELQGGPLAPLAADVLQASSWGPADVRAREARLLAAVERMWKIDLPGERGADMDRLQSRQEGRRAAV